MKPWQICANCGLLQLPNQRCKGDGKVKSAGYPACQHFVLTQDRQLVGTGGDNPTKMKRWRVRCTVTVYALDATDAKAQVARKLEGTLARITSASPEPNTPKTSIR